MFHTVDVVHEEEGSNELSTGINDLTVIRGDREYSDGEYSL